MYPDRVKLTGIFPFVDSTHKGLLSVADFPYPWNLQFPGIPTQHLTSILQLHASPLSSAQYVLSAIIITEKMTFFLNNRIARKFSLCSPKKLYLVLSRVHKSATIWPYAHAAFYVPEYTSVNLVFHELFQGETSMKKVRNQFLLIK